MNLHELKLQFLKEFPIEKLRSISLDEYSNLNKDSFCYWLESKTNDLGSIWGGSSYKFGIFKRANLDEGNYNKSRKSDGEYAWYGKYGETSNNAFITVREKVHSIARAASINDLDQVEKIEFSPSVKWKIAFLYSDYHILNIFSFDALIAIAQNLNIKTQKSIRQSDLNELILKNKGATDFYDFSKKLWKAYEKDIDLTKKILNLNSEVLEDSCEEITTNGLTKDSESTTYDVFWNNYLLPPKLVIQKALETQYNLMVERTSFKGGNSEPSFKILRKQNFKIIEKIKVRKLFSEYLENHFKNGGASSSYKTAFNNLNKILLECSKIKVPLYNIISQTEIEKLYNFVIDQQKLPDYGIFKHVTPESYHKNKFYSASIKKYLEFLGTLNINKSLTRKPTHDNAIDLTDFKSNSQEAGLKFSEPLVNRFTASLMTKPFLILSGLSGSGKTKLAQAFSMWISDSEDQYCMVPVGADWTNRDPILGYVNALDDEKYVYPENGALKLMQRANEDSTRPYFLILDEMNLSHVERYFADFLSVMESKDKFKLHEGDKIEQPPKALGWPDNLFVIGTVNIDETTYMFSPKVLDRANVIEFRVKEKDMKIFLTQSHELDMNQLKHQGGDQAADFLARASEATSVALDDKQQKVLMSFFNELSKLGAEFGYRTASEITSFLDRITKLEDSTKITDDHLDYAIIQKLLPKLHGSRNKLVKVLEVLGKNCLKTSGNEKKIFSEDITKEDIRFSLSYEKLARMHKNAIDNGFASFAEA
ncbi:AAA family ATPase [Flavobacteriaceae bacterium]|nr:AAA family ATPase [Flavobacteriaceae bacterium]